MNTKKIITDAMLELLRVKPFEDISVQAILNHAQVSRSTFYRHFHDKYDVINSYYTQFLENLLSGREFASANEYVKQIFRFLYENKYIFRKLLSADVPNSFWDYLYRFTYRFSEEHYLQRMNLRALSIEDKVALEFYTSGQVQITKKWMERDCRESITDMAKWALSLQPQKYIPFEQSEEE